MFRYWLETSPGVLKGTNSAKEWLDWFQNADRMVARDFLEAPGNHRRVIEVETLIMGMGPWLDDNDEILPYETMVFIDGVASEREAYASRSEALDGHREWLEAIRGRG